MVNSADYLSADKTIIRLVCSYAAFSDIKNCWRVCKLWKSVIRDLEYYPLFLDRLQVEVIPPATAEMGVFALRLLPKPSYDQMIFLKILMLIGDWEQIPVLVYPPKYQMIMNIDGHQWKIVISYKRPPFCEVGWYMTQSCVSFPGEKLITKIGSDELAHIKKNRESFYQS